MSVPMTFDTFVDQEIVAHIFKQFVGEPAANAYAQEIVQAFRTDSQSIGRDGVIAPIEKADIKAEGDWLTLTFKSGDRYAIVKLKWERGLVQ